MQRKKCEACQQDAHLLLRCWCNKFICKPCALKPEHQACIDTEPAHQPAPVPGGPRGHNIPNALTGVEKERYAKQHIAHITRKLVDGEL